MIDGVVFRWKKFKIVIYLDDIIFFLIVLRNIWIDFRELILLIFEINFLIFWFCGILF